MATLVNIGQFSRMTHLSVKALRHYHDTGVLVPAAIDPFTGYRSYDVAQVPAAQVIRRLRDLGMPLDSVRTVVAAADVETRNREIAAHLTRMEDELARTQASVAELRALLTGPAVRPDIVLRSIPAVTALAVAEVVTPADLGEWAPGVFSDIATVLKAGGLKAAGLKTAGTVAAGCFGGLYPGDFFEVERAEVTVFLPVEPVSQPLPPGRVRLTQIPAADAAVAVHQGSLADADRTYAALGTVIAERAIGVDGPIREYYTVGFTDTEDEARHRTEVCWPVFRTTRS
jgi:DNA-binding transcriptional MerR regulator/effector-binding domain-containing protein